MKKSKIVFIISVVIVVLAIAIILNVINNKPKQPQKIGFGTLTEEEGNDLMQKLETSIQKDEKLFSQYGGCYMTNKLIVICLTNDSWVAVRKIKKIVEDDENIYIKKVKHSQQELETVRHDASTKWQELLDSENDAERQLGRSISTLGVDIRNNRVQIGVCEYSEETLAKLETLFGNEEIIFYVKSFAVDSVEE